MDNTPLMQALAEYGADIAGIESRFFGDEEFFADCFSRFFAEKCHALLGEAMAQGSYKAAFEEAHALKGLSANLGLTPYYHAICRLVESLRAADYVHAAIDYEEAVQQFRRLAALFPQLGAGAAVN